MNVRADHQDPVAWPAHSDSSARTVVRTDPDGGRWPSRRLPPPRRDGRDGGRARAADRPAPGLPPTPPYWRAAVSSAGRHLVEGRGVAHSRLPRRSLGPRPDLTPETPTLTPADRAHRPRVRSAHGRSTTAVVMAGRLRDLGARTAAHAGRRHGAGGRPAGPRGRTDQPVRLEPCAPGLHAIDGARPGGGHTKGAGARQGPGGRVQGGDSTRRKDHAGPRLAEPGRGAGCRLPGPGGTRPGRGLPPRAVAAPSRSGACGGSGTVGGPGPARADPPRTVARRRRRDRRGDRCRRGPLGRHPVRRAQGALPGGTGGLEGRLRGGGPRRRRGGLRARRSGRPVRHRRRTPTPRLGPWRDACGQYRSRRRCAGPGRLARLDRLREQRRRRVRGRPDPRPGRTFRAGHPGRPRAEPRRRARGRFPHRFRPGPVAGGTRWPPRQHASGRGQGRLRIPRDDRDRRPPRTGGAVHRRLGRGSLQPRSARRTAAPAHHRRHTRHPGRPPGDRRVHRTGVPGTRRAGMARPPGRRSRPAHPESRSRQGPGPGPPARRGPRQRDPGPLGPPSDRPDPHPGRPRPATTDR